LKYWIGIWIDAIGVSPPQPHQVHHIILVVAINLGALIQGITLAIPVVVSLFAFITDDASFVISSCIS
jgi:hypothetical protein